MREQRCVKRRAACSALCEEKGSVQRAARCAAMCEEKGSGQRAVLRCVNEGLRERERDDERAKRRTKKKGAEDDVAWSSCEDEDTDADDVQDGETRRLREKAADAWLCVRVPPMRALVRFDTSEKGAQRPPARCAAVSC